MNLADRLARISTLQALFGGIFLAIIYYALIYDNGTTQEKAIEDKRTQIVEVQKKLDHINKAIQDAERYEATIKDLGDKVNLILKYIPEQFRVSDLMKLLSLEAKGAGTNIVGLSEFTSSRSSNDYGFYDEISVKVNLEGTFNQIMLFLSYLSRSERIITLNQFNLANRSMAVTGSPLLSFDGTFVGYRYIGAQEEKRREAERKAKGAG